MKFKRSHRVSTTIELCFEVEIEGTAEPFIPGVHTLPNGDPGYPSEGGGIEDVCVALVRKGRDGKYVRINITEFLDRGQLEEVKNVLEEYAADEAEEDEYRRGEYKAERYEEG